MVYQQFFSLLLLMLYFISLFLLGAWICQKWLKTLPVVFFLTASFLLGVGVGIPLTYVLACLLTWTGEPILWGMVSTLVLSSWIVVRRWKYSFIKLRPKTFELRTTVSDLLLVLFSLLFSTWLMTKTFRGGVGGQIFTGSNNVFDFGLLIGFVRSMSWGSTIPLSSPFESGLPFFYHFFFQFWVAILEYCGLPLVLAVNIPSVLSFSALLVIVYFFPRLVWKKSIVVGWLAVLLVITHSTLTFWYLLLENGISFESIQHLWQLPTYPYAGPFDGSIISIFMTLNNYVNQRHLAFPIAFALLLYVFLVRKGGRKESISVKEIVFLSTGAGVLWYWNMAVSLGLMFLVTVYLVFQKKIREMVVVLALYGICLCILLLPYMKVWITTFHFFQNAVKTQSAVSVESAWNPVSYLWNNLGVLPLAGLLGAFVLRKDWRRMLPFLLFFVLVCLLAVYRHRGFDQKFLSFALIGFDILAAVGLGWLWEKGFIAKFVTIGFIIILTVSGFIDLMAVKNEFAFPFLSEDTLPVVTWIRNETPKTAVFISYSDMIDPVVLAGRKNYFGFFGNVGWTDRSSIVKSIYAGDVDTAKKLGISYILAPNWKKDDFSYTVDTMYFQENKMEVYRDEKYSIFAVRK